MRKFVASAAVVAAAAATAVIMPTSAHALSANNLTLCSVGAHSDVLVFSNAAPPPSGPTTFAIARDTCSDLALAAGSYTVQLAEHGRTPIYGPSTANDPGNFPFDEQPFDHATVKYTALPPGGMAYNTDSPVVTVNIGNGGSGAEVDFVYSNQMH